LEANNLVVYFNLSKHHLAWLMRLFITLVQSYFSTSSELPIRRQASGSC
jgi:hypothetical protein